MSNIDNTLSERGQRYGDFEGHAFITQELKDTMHASPNWARLKPDQKEALHMAAHKIGRILNGDPDYIDSWHDIIGYTRLVEQRLEEEFKILSAQQSPLSFHNAAEFSGGAAEVDAGVSEQAAPAPDRRVGNLGAAMRAALCDCPACQADQIYARDLADQQFGAMVRAKLEEVFPDGEFKIVRYGR